VQVDRIAKRADLLRIFQGARGGVWRESLKSFSHSK